MRKIAMWSGPRNISTALMRSFENRPDTFVTDEPFYAHYLYNSQEEHPLWEKIIQKGEINWDSVVQIVTGDIPKGKTIWLQKHMAHHNLPGKNLQWIEKMRNILLIRHPRDVILSYNKMYEVKNITQLGYPQQIELFKILTDKSSSVPIIIDARDVLEDPARMLKQLCNKLEIVFYQKMLSWPAGKRKSDGLWGEHWYRSVEKSTGFQKYTENNDAIPLKHKELFSECMSFYQQLYQHRMR